MDREQDDQREIVKHDRPDEHQWLQLQLNGDEDVRIKDAEEADEAGTLDRAVHDGWPRGSLIRKYLSSSSGSPPTQESAGRRSRLRRP